MQKMLGVSGVRAAVVRGGLRAWAGAGGALPALCGHSIRCSEMHAATADTQGQPASPAMPAPMLSNQHRLPALPVPSLRDSLRRYRDALRPLTAVGDGEMHATDAAIAAFLGSGDSDGDRDGKGNCSSTNEGEGEGEGEGEALQRELLRRAASTPAGEAYIGPFWDAMYLEGRWCLKTTTTTPVVQ